MEFVTIESLGKKVILLNGASADNKTDKTLEIEAPDNLREAARSEIPTPSPSVSCQDGGWLGPDAGSRRLTLAGRGSRLQS